MNAEEVAGLVVFFDLVVFKINFGGGVGDVESVALVGGEVGIFGGEDGFAIGGITGHGLVEENIFVSSGLAVKGVVSVG